MAGLVKVVQVLERCCMVPNLHLQQVNPKLELDGFATVLASECCVLRMNDEVLMGVSSFGYSGTNSHALIGVDCAEAAATAHEQSAVQYQNTAFVWLDVSDNALTAMQLLGVSTAALEAGSGTQWERSWPSATCSYMAQHRVVTAWVAHQWHQALATCAWCVRQWWQPMVVLLVRP
jgi:acyl transferase domain-containing protein